MADKELNILIRAKALTQQGFAAVQNQARQFAQRVNKVSSAGVGGGIAGFTDKFAKSIAVIGAMEGAFRGVAAVTAAIKGDTKEMVRQLESLPLGVGTGIRAFKEMLGLVTGISGEIKRLNEEAAKLAKQSAARAQRTGEQQRIKAAAKALGKTLDEQLRIQGKQGLDRQIERIQIEAERQLRSIDAKIAEGEKLETLKGTTRRFFAGSREKIQELATKRIAELREQADKQAAKQAADLAKQQQRQAQQAADKAKAVARVQVSALAQLEQLSLRALGRRNEAELVAIKRSFEARIRAAQSVGEREALIHSQGLAERAAKEEQADRARQKIAAARLQGATAPGQFGITREFRGLAQTSQANVAARNMQDLLGANRKSVGLLDTINRTLEGVRDVIEDAAAQAVTGIPIRAGG